MRRISTPTRRAIVPAVIAAVLAAMPMSGSHADEADAKAILKAMSD